MDRIFFDYNENSTIDFTDRTDNTAWYGYLESNNDSFLYTGSPEKFKENIFSSDNYNTISYSDNQNMLSQTPGYTNGYPYFLYEITVLELTTKIKVKYEGYSSQPFIHDVPNEINLFIFNYNTNNWDQFINKNTDDFDCNISCTITDNISDYLNNSRINILIVGPYGAGNSTSTLSCDYFAIINSHTIEE